MALCPCGSGRTFTECCEPYIAARALPPTAEALMRSRYSAFTVGDVDYICEGRVPEERVNTNRAFLERWVAEAEWKGLEIHRVERGGPDDESGTVEFSAHFRLDGFGRVHRELATFRRVEGRWYYVSGRITTPAASEPVRTAVKAGRNDPCPCGSGKKFKKCCAAA